MRQSATARTGLTWEDFLALPEDPEYRHAELVDGEIVVNPPTHLHQRAVFRLMRHLDDWIMEGPGRGDITMDPPVRIGPRRGFLPDVAWYREEKCAPPGEPPAFEGPPDLVAEVLSPSTRLFDTHRKQADYARIGVAELWLIDPDGPTALVFRRPADATGPVSFELADEVAPDGALTSPLLPGLKIPLAGLIRR